MKRFLAVIIGAALVWSLPALAHGGDLNSCVQARGGGSRGGSTRVRGYTKKDGTHVAPHQRSAPNKTKTDNYSTKGNVNPYTGKKGTKKP